ncbi:hypothetical protein [Achromobacter sp. DH1f]|uniref:hypothetical protein n=1 Tax=Achromobacter sp. DH1f TaxID=1397275 RepID=UPI00046A228E|nr:hypothetical protein [Achromobacter sp. DH1f]
MKEQLWTVVRFPDGSWSYGGKADDSAYELCEKWRLLSRTGQHAVKLAQGRRRRGHSGRLVEIYDPLCPDDPRRGAILGEMRLVVEAATDDDATRAIKWWGAWPNPQHESALEFVRSARTMFRQVQSPSS